MEQVQFLAARLLHTAAVTQEDHHDGGDHQDSEDSTLNLRIASVFIIAIAGLVGGVPPLFSQAFSKPSHPVARLFRALSAGIILSLALVHIFPEAVIELGELEALMGSHPYNAAGACAVFGLLLMVVMESAIHHFIANRMQRPRLPQPTAEATEHANPHAVAALNVHGHAMGDPHTHVCMGSAHMMLDNMPLSSTRDLVLATMFELGCIFHSFIIGLTLGVNTSGITEVRSLLIALAFHQWLEGIALGSFIMRAHINRTKGLLMVLTYSLTCPVGVAIGIGISNSYDPESTTAIATQGVFNGISAGMLLYIALVHLIAEDFSRREVPAEDSSDTKDAQASKAGTHSHDHADHHHGKAGAHSHDTHSHGTHSHGAHSHHAHAEHSHKAHAQHSHSSHPGHSHGAHSEHSHKGQVSHSHGLCSHSHGHEGAEQAWVLAASATALLLGAAFMCMLGVWA